MATKANPNTKRRSSGEDKLIDELMLMPEEDKTVFDFPELGEMNLLNCMEWIYETSNGCKLSDAYLEKAHDALKYVADKFEITPRQCILFAIVCNETANDDDCTMNDLRHHLNLTGFELMRYKEELKELEARHIVFRTNGFQGRNFRARQVYMDAITEDRALPKKSIVGLSFDEFFKAVNDALRYPIARNVVQDSDLTYSELKGLCEANTQLEFVKQLFGGPKLNKQNFLAFIYICNELVSWNRDKVSLVQSDMDDVVGDGYEYGQLCNSIVHGTNTLVKREMIEVTCNDGFRGDSVSLTETARKKFLAEYTFVEKEMEDTNLLKPEKITRKELFYNPREEREIQRLANVLDEKNYEQVCDRMEKCGMRRGICVLLSGGPGTGKTETVLQLARQSGRPIMQVNVSDIKDKFVGESEKNATAIFNHYKELVQKSKVTPILFLNECDQILGKRHENCRSSVEQMDNSLQNIFLQQMEDLTGVLICTTNLVQNLDAAFERRFLIKVNFEKPSIEARAAIWKSMLKNIKDSDAQTLAEEFDFSGGQIENISRKALIDTALTGEEPTLEQFRTYCSHERYQKSDSRPRIGF